MPATKQIVDAGKRVGKKVLSTDTAQGVVEAVVDKLEDITVDKADDVAETVKTKAAKAGGRSKQSTAKRSTAKKSTATKSTAKKSTAKKSTAKKSTAKGKR